MEVTVDSSNKSFCSLLWKHMCIRPNFVTVPCCRFTKLTSEIDFTGIRQSMLRGESVQGCEECYDEEVLTQESLRLSSNKQFGTDFTATETSTADQVEYLEIFVGSVCNLKCIGCSPLLSTSLYEEYNQNNWELPEIFNPVSNFKIDFIERLTHLKHIKFVGGEPILNKLHDKIMSSLQQTNMKGLRLSYYTNCTVWPNSVTLATWENVGSINLNLSIDGIGARNEYLRKNSNWTKVNDIVSRYFSLAEKNQHLTLQISGTVSILNMLYLDEIEQWFQELRNRFPLAKTEPIYLTYLTDPQALSPHRAPAGLISAVIAKYGDGSTQQQLKIANLLKTMKSPNGSKDEESFLDYVGRFDQARNTSFKKIFPELGAFF